MRNQTAACEDILGYRFHDTKLLTDALRHSSMKTDEESSNERLEFLGDAILGLVISEWLFHEFSDYPEGEMTQIKSVVVSRNTLADIARETGLGNHIIVGRGIAQTRSVPDSLLANAFEAVIAAIYLDGGMEVCRSFILRNTKNHVEAVMQNKHKQNYKSLLQQYTQRTYAATPTYKLAGEDGPDHDKEFSIIAVIKDTEYGLGKGPSKKEAEQEAARKTLEALTESE